MLPLRSPTGGAASPNFGFLAAHNPLLAEHAARAERYLFDDPPAAIAKLRLLGELLAREAAAHTNLIDVQLRGLTPIAIVEAKRQTKDVAAAIAQSKRYARGYARGANDVQPPGAPWGECQIPFLFATNGRPFLQQLRDKSGIWFLDSHRATNHARPLEG